MTLSQADWDNLQALAEKTAQPGEGPGGVPDTEWERIKHALTQLQAEQQWSDVVRLRDLFRPIFARDTAWGLAVLQELDTVAIQAVRHLGDKAELGHLLGARGHNLHRQGYHREAIEAFDESAECYQQVGESFPALKSYYMTSLCYRALGDRERAKEILNNVLSQIPPDNPWRGNPLQVLAWLTQDEGRLEGTEILLREALELQQQTHEPDILVAGTLADLGEVVGLLGRVAEAKEIFERGLAILAIHQGQYDRQEARTKLKFAELLTRQRAYTHALRLLDEADDKASGYGHYYDLLWRIELARSLIYLRRGQWQGAWRKLQMTLRYRRELKLSNVLLVRQLVKRWQAGTGLPR